MVICSPINIQNYNNTRVSVLTLSTDCVGNNLIIKTTHSTSRSMWSVLPGSLPVFLYFYFIFYFYLFIYLFYFFAGEEPGYEANWGLDAYLSVCWHLFVTTSNLSTRVPYRKFDIPMATTRQLCTYSPSQTVESYSPITSVFHSDW